MNGTSTQSEEPKMPRSGGEPNVPIEQAGAETIDSLSKRVSNLEKDFSDQKQNNRNIIYAVLIAAFLILLTVAVEVIIFHTRSNEDVLELQNQYFQEVKDLRNDISEMQLDFQSKVNTLKSAKEDAKTVPGK